MVRPMLGDLELEQVQLVESDEDQVVVRKGGLEPFHTFNRFLYVE